MRVPHVLIAVVLVGALAVLAAPLLAQAPKGATSADKVKKVDVKSDKPGADGVRNVTVKIDIEDGWHLYANPVNDALLESNKTELTFTSESGTVEAKINYPTGKKVADGATTFNIYEKSVTITAKVPEPKTGKLKLKVSVSACDEKRCLVRGQIEAEVP